MENASKALIIAGAILVSIILISLGIMVMNSTGDVTSRMGEEMDSAAIQSFNSKFTQYAGSQKGSTVKSLINTIQSSNASSTHTVTINFTSSTYIGTTKPAANNLTDVQAALKPTASYKIKVNTDSNGYVNKIDIS